MSDPAPGSANQRQHDRQDVAVTVHVVIPGRSPMKLTTGNLSDSGVFLLCGGRAQPAINTEILITLEEFLESAEPMAMRARVAHRNDIGFGIELLGPVD